MIKMKQAVVVLFILSGILLLTACTQMNSDDIEGLDPQLVADFIEGEQLSSSFNDSRLPTMKGIVENEHLQLFIDEATAEIAVVVKESGEIWYSNPQDRQTDPFSSGINKELLSSQVRIEFFNMLGQSNTVNSFTDSVMNEQVAYRLIPNGIKVNYQFGTDKKTIDDMPEKISKERLDSLMEKLDSTGQRALKIAYREDKDEPGTFLRSDGTLQGLQLTRALQAFEDAGYTEEDLEYDIKENNLDQTKPQPRIFLVSVEYSLDGDSLIVNVPREDVHFPVQFPISMISVLTYFGAGGVEDEGTILVPDGSGALIHFNNGKTAYPAYRQEVYGLDMAIDPQRIYVREEKARLPVFGMIRDNNAFMGIIEQGGQVATINADISGKLNGYNNVYAGFKYISKGDVTLFANEQRRSLPKFQEEPMKTDFTIRYAFLTDQKASYEGMAHYYRDYLLAKGDLPPMMASDASDDTPFYLKLVGGISKKKHFAGIPHQSLEPLTTFEQAEHIIDQLKERDIHNITLKYAGWFNGGLDHKVPKKVSVDRKLGGRKSLENFIQFTKDNHIDLFPDVAALYAYNKGGFRVTKEASRTLSEVPAAIYPLDQALNRRDRDRTPSYVLSPRYLDKYISSLLKGIERYDFTGLSLRDLANNLNSDYRKNKQIDRVDAEALSVEALQKIHEQGLQLMVDGGNAYALPYVSHITNMPLSDSGFKIVDESIPFYQMVIRGHIGYTGTPYNLSTYTNYKQYILKSLEYGSHVYFEWIYAPNHAVKETEYDYMYSVHYNHWIDQAVEIYQEVNDALKLVNNEKLVAHEKLSEGVYKSTFDNGVYFIVNYNLFDVTVDDVSIEAESYIIGGEKR